jgi:hypothetical protein
MSRIDVVIRGAGVVVVAGVLAAGGSYVVGGGGEAVSANLYAVAPASSDGSTSCVRSSTELSYADALAANAVCKGNGTSSTSWDVACKAATGGDEVGVMPGTYGFVTSGNYLMGGPQSTGVNASEYDCSDGTGVDYDPNWREKGDAEASLANWVTFKPGVDCQGTPNVNFAMSTGGGRATFSSANWHLIIGSAPGDTTGPGGECINFNRTIYVFDRNSVVSASNARPSNIMFRGKSPSERMQMYGLELRGVKNLLIENVDYGPSLQCVSQNGPASPESIRCNPSGPYFESVYANNGTNLTGCSSDTADTLCAGWFNGGGANEFTEPFIHGSVCCYAYNNVRFQTFQLHDGQVAGTGSNFHPGCFMFDGTAGIPGLPAHNMVFDGVSCERQVIGVQSQDSGLTVQNSYFGCAVVDLPQTSPAGQWDVCANGQPSVRLYSRADLGGGPISNVLYRYNVFYATNAAAALLVTTPDATFGTYSNVRIVGNIFIGGSLTGCSITGVSCDRNSIFNTTATGASNTTTLSCDPTVDSDQSTPDDLWRETTQLDPRLNGSSCGVPTLDPSALGADYQLGFDIDGTARGASATKAGADNS